jgi:hypothetical protein
MALMMLSRGTRVRPLGWPEEIVKTTRHVLALDIASLFEALAKGTQALGNRLGRSDFEKPYHRHLRLLRAHRERPRRRVCISRFPNRESG